MTSARRGCGTSPKVSKPAFREPPSTLVLGGSPFYEARYQSKRDVSRLGPAPPTLSWLDVRLGFTYARRHGVHGPRNPQSGAHHARKEGQNASWFCRYRLYRQPACLKTA